MAWNSKLNPQISETDLDLMEPAKIGGFINYLISEATSLKSLNTELAKSMTESKTTITHLNDEINMLQRELLQKNIIIRKLTKCVNEVRDSTLASINYAKNIINVANRVQNLHNVINTNSSQYDTSLNNDDTTHRAIKYRADDDVTFRPTINLRRTNELPVEKYKRLKSSQQRFNIVQDQCEQVEIEDVIKMSDAENITSRSLDFLLQEESNSLVTLREKDNLDSRSTKKSVVQDPNNSQHAVLSGVFQDVRVYLSSQSDILKYLDSPTESKRTKSPSERNLVQTSTNTTKRNESESSTNTRRCRKFSSNTVRFKSPPSTSRSKDVLEIHSCKSELLSDLTEGSFRTASSDTSKQQQPIKIKALKSSASTSKSLSPTRAVFKRRTKEDTPSKSSIFGNRKSKLIVEKPLKVTRSQKSKLNKAKERALKNKIKEAAIKAKLDEKVKKWINY